MYVKFQLVCNLIENFINMLIIFPIVPLEV